MQDMRVQAGTHYCDGKYVYPLVENRRQCIKASASISWDLTKAIAEFFFTKIYSCVSYIPKQIINATQRS